MGERARREQKAAELVRHRYPAVDAATRRVLAGLLVQPGWRVFIRNELPATGIHAYLIGTGGVLGVVIGDGMPDFAAARRLHAEAEHAFAHVRVGGQVVASIRVVAVRPEAGEARSRADGLYQAVREVDLTKYLTTAAKHLTKTQVTAITTQTRLPQFTQPDLAGTAKAEPEPGLLDANELNDDQVAAALTRPFEQWLTFLHPAQRSIVTRRFSGPARISGPAGTGKTVVALHRLRHLARRTTGPLLFTTFVRTLPTVHRQAFLRLAPELDGRVEFIGLHAWSRKMLSEHGIDARVRQNRIENALGRAWQKHRGALEPIAQFGYWKTEIDTVIKGRGIQTFDEYRAIRRLGRTLLLTAAQREPVWRLYLDYQANLADEGLLDHNDVIALAYHQAGETPRYAAVVADEVQDISLMGLRLLHRLAGGGPDGLLLVGDGQQQVYPGGWRLSEADISIQGRGAVLRVNYRNSAAVLRFAQGLGATNEIDDLDGAAGVALQDAEVVTGGGVVQRWRGTRAELSAALAAAVRGLTVPLGRSAVIAFDSGEVERLAAVLAKAGVPTVRLEHYTGQDDDILKIGTVHRAKGLDFQAVIAVHTADAIADPEQRELRARQLMVAATRARDALWWGVVDPVTKGSPGASAATQR